MAGYRGQAPYVTFLFFRLVMPILFLIFAVLYVFVISNMQQTTAVKVGICIGATWAGMQAPMVFLKNAISKRQLSIRRAFPDALDLLLICIESGMSVEAAFRRGRRRDRLAVDPAGRGILADDGGTVLSPGPQDGLRKSCQADRPRGREVGVSRLMQGPSATARRSDKRCA